MYCGNNQNNRDLLNGNKVLGTPYRCLQKGIGQGLRMPCDPEYKNEYTPIDDFKIYCGGSPVLPQGYDKMGSPVQCLVKGVGIGKSQKASRCSALEFRFGKGVIRFWLLYLIIFLPICLYLFFNTPNFFKKTETVNSVVTEKKDWSKLIPYTILISIVIYVLLRKILRR